MYHQKNRDKILSQLRERYRKNKPLYRERMSRWAKRNKDKILEYQRRYRAKHSNSAREGKKRLRSDVIQGYGGVRRAGGQCPRVIEKGYWESEGVTIIIDMRKAAAHAGN